MKDNLIERLSDEADQCRNDGADDIAKLLADALDDGFAQGRISNHTGRKAAAELRRLEAANAELLKALKLNAQALSWLAFGECRGFTDNLPTALEATTAARAAIKKHGGAA